VRVKPRNTGGSASDGAPVAAGGFRPANPPRVEPAVTCAAGCSFNCSPIPWADGKHRTGKACPMAVERT
jgi:hypothetical protein